MCKYCDLSETKIEKLDDDEEESPCEWVSEESGPGVCDEPAAYVVSDWFVYDHLCAAHKLEVEPEMAEGLGEFIEAVGFQSQYEIKAIDDDETCDYMDFDQPGWQRCGKKAGYANYLLDTALLCPEHAAEAQSDAEKT